MPTASFRVLALGLLLGTTGVRAEPAPESAAAQDLLVVPSPEPRPGGFGAASPPAAKETATETVPTAKDGAAPEPEPTVAARAEDGVLPLPFAVSRYEELWQRSPFQLESAAPPVESAGLAQRYALTGIAEIGGEKIAFLMERATQQRIMVKQQDSGGGLSLVQIDVVQKKYEDSTATIRQGSEVGVVKFDAGAGMGAPAMAMPQAQFPAYAPPMAPSLAQRAEAIKLMANVPANRAPQPVPGQASPAGIQAPGVPLPPGGAAGVSEPGQQPMPPPRVIRRRAIVPAAP